MKINSCVLLSPNFSFLKLFSSSLKFYSNLLLYHTFLLFLIRQILVCLSTICPLLLMLKILTFVPPKSFADLILPSFIKFCLGVFSKLISVFANFSFFESCFSTLFKNAVVVSLLKIPSLNKSLPSSYRLISNLNYISKILERFFLTGI